MSSPVRFPNLPSELILEIVKELDWRDLLSLRQTCKHLSELSKALPIWRNLVAACLNGFPWRLERPLASYTSSELEYVLLRFKSAEIGWTKDDKFPARQRALNLRVPQSRPFHLVEGGRWVLFATTGGSVEYVDLDAQDLVERNLVPVQTSGSSTKMAVDVDRTEQLLTFTLGLSISTRNEEWLQIWRVSLTPESDGDGGRGPGASLSAQRLAWFIPNPSRPLEGFSIGGSYIVYYFWLENYDPETHLAVVNWQEHLRQGDAAEPMSRYPMCIISNHLVEKVNAIYFFPDNKLFISTALRTLIYDLRLVPESTTFELPAIPTLPLVQRHTPCALISRPFFFSNSVRFVYSDTVWLQGMTVDLSGPLPTVQNNKLMDLPISLLRGAFPILDYRKGAFTRRNGGIVMLAYPWPDDQHQRSPSVVIKNFSREDWTGRARGIDEFSGRVLLEPFILSKPVIALDFALIYRSMF